MNGRSNFKWLVNVIYTNIIIKLYRVNKDDNIKYYIDSFEILDVLDTTGDEFEIKFANIDDITKFITMGIVRFTNNSGDIIDIPFRNLYKLYGSGNMVSLYSAFPDVSLSDIEAFSVFNDEIINDNYYVEAWLLSTKNDDLDRIMDIAFNFGNMDMQEKFNALSEVNMINYRRMQEDKKTKFIDR